jgi:dTDP-4-dehydrorhamnose reductase
LKVLLFGATGLLGKDLLKRKPPSLKVVAAPRSFDIVDPEQMKKAFTEFKPDMVVNTAGMSSVDKAEDHVQQAFDLNGKAPALLASLCEASSIPLIHFSTDYVYPDANEKPFSESDVPHPLNVYGKSKLEGEKAVQRWEQHYILRTSSLYGTSRRAHAMWVLEALQSKNKLTVAEDMICSPTYTGDLARWIYQLIEHRPAFGIYHVTHKGFCSRYDFAFRLCELLNAPQPYPIERISLEALHLRAPRPDRPLLAVDKWEKNIGPLLTWEEGLKNFLHEIQS